MTTTANQGGLDIRTSSNHIVLSDGDGNPRGIFDGSGNFLVGTTDLTPGNGNTDTGHLLKNDGRLFVSSASNSQFNRNSDGDVLTFRRSGNLVGSIGTIDGDLLVHSSASGHKGLRFGNGYLAPTNNSGAVEDNTTNLGLSGNRFKDLYLSGGVYLGGTAAANKLDDYEEGTFTPSFVASTTTVTVNSAKYTKIGQMVHISMYIANISPATSADEQRITGLPFTIAPNSHYSAGTIGYATDADVEGVGVLGATGQSYIYFHYIDGTSGAALTRANWNSIKSSGLALIISMSYMTDS